MEERFFNACRLSHHSNNKFILLPEKENFYSHLNMEDINDIDYALEKKKLLEFYEKYAQSNTLLLADLFENFWNIYLKIYELDPPKCFSPLESAFQVNF